MDNSQLLTAPCSSGEKILKKKALLLKYNNKSYPLEIFLSEKNIIFSMQEKYNLFLYENSLSFETFQDLHKYCRLFDNLNEIYNDLVNCNIGIKSEDIEQGKVTLFLNVNIITVIYLEDLPVKVGRKIIRLKMMIMLSCFS